MSMEKKEAPFGLWPSPISPALLGTQLRFNDVRWDSDGETLVWAEGRSDRGLLVCKPGKEAIRDLTFEGSVRGGVGYGGGEFGIVHGIVYYVDKGSRLFRRPLGYHLPEVINPAFGSVAAPTPSPDGRWLLYVHSSDDRRDSLGLVHADGNGWPIQIASGADFYMQPAWHPQSKRIAWIEWNHPNMPWDGTRLKLAYLAGDPPTLAQEEVVAGDRETPVFQPEFSPDGRWLSYIAEEGEWDRLYLLDLESGERRILVEGGNLQRPAWIQGIRTYGWSPSSQHIFYFLSDGGFSSLWKVELDSASSTRIDLGAYTDLDQIAVSPHEDKIALIANAPGIPPRIIVWQKDQIEIVRRSDPEIVSPDDLPHFRSISWQAADGTLVYGVYSPPVNSSYQSGGMPPAIVYIHGGPTSQSVASYNGEAAFFTSRGYAYLAVNYRGSTGYGRTYRNTLRGRWGELDMEDAVGGAQALVDQGLADPKRLVIKGGSSGGYTVLNALIHYPGKFKAGICSYGVSNLFTLASETHKFEERYTDSLVGTLPEAAELYREWSPIFHADRIQDALAIFQGSADQVVVPEQSETIVAELCQHKSPYIYRVYEGEGHGFRRTDTIVSFYQDVERFLRQYVLFGG